MHALLSDLGITLPVLAAPMAGGPSTPVLVVAAARAGSLGFLAGGYRSPGSLADRITEVRAAGVPFGVNLFAPNPVPVDPEAFRRYADELRPEAERLGVDLTDTPVEDDDGWRDKVDLLLADPVPLVSFTFGIPEPSVLAALQRAGSTVTQTVTSVDEARAAAAAGADALIVQAAAAGGHSGTLTPANPPPALPLPALVGRVRDAAPGLPVIAAGGLSTPEEVAAAVRAGADAAMVGTALLRTEESGTSEVHRAALAEDGRDTVVTRAFTGRPARALRNAFTDRFGATAPLGYPAVHHLTGPLRKAAAAAGDIESVHLWAGTGYRNAREGPVEAAIQRLAPE